MTKLTESQLINWFKLTKVKGVGPRKLLRLFSIFGDVDSLMNAREGELLRSGTFNQEQILEWERLKGVSDENFQRVIDECKRNNIELLPLIDKDYPKKLLSVPYPPYTLFLKGDASLLDSEIVAIVGTREPSEDAVRWTFETAKSLSLNGFTIISGGALGIDTAAHRGSLETPTGKTISVFGTGLLSPFPEQNIPFFKEIERDGLLVSEHLPRFPGSKIALIQRNRITSGLSNAVILSASKANGGAMVQAKTAFVQRVPIFIPSLNLGLTPNEGIKIAKEKYSAIEMENISILMNFMNKRLPVKPTVEGLRNFLPAHNEVKAET